MNRTLLSLCLITIPLLSQENQVLENRIIVYGEGTAETPPDRAVMSFSVVGLGPSIETAMQSARSKQSEITHLLRPIGLTDQNFTTSRFYSGDNREGKAFLSSSKDFRTQMDVMITLDSLAWLDEVIRVLAGSQVNRLSNISFRLKSDSLLKIITRDLAVDNALTKAQRIAARLGVQLGRLVYLEEVFGLPTYSVRSATNYMPQRNTTTTVSIQQSDIAFYGGQRFSANFFVKAVFEIQ